jgi:hypothetical protein
VTLQRVAEGIERVRLDLWRHRRGGAFRQQVVLEERQRGLRVGWKGDFDR